MSLIVCSQELFVQMRRILRFRCILCLTLAITILYIVNLYYLSPPPTEPQYPRYFTFNGPVSREEKSKSASFNNWRNLTQDEIDRLSILGRRLYLSEDIGKVKDRYFTIHIWKSFFEIMPHYMKQYGEEILDPFRHCSVRNCRFSHLDSDVYDADAVLIHLHKTEGPHTFPERRNPHQRWIWLTDEAPYLNSTFNANNDTDFSDYNGYFNWSMTYKMDSDIPVPYGRTIMKSKSESSKYKEVDYFSLKSKMAAIMVSDCLTRNHREDYVEELENYIPLDVYGSCGNLTCPGRMKEDCLLMFDYKFYLAFENSNCVEYITEKLWWHAIEHGAVPVVMGTKIEDYKKMLPPGSFIHVDDFDSPSHLAQYLLKVGEDRAKYMQYHAWRSQFTVSNEHGYAGADDYHYCRICEALNYNDEAPKVYNHLEEFWNSDEQCYPPSWVKENDTDYFTYWLKNVSRNDPDYYNNSYWHVSPENEVNNDLNEIA